MRHLTHKVLPGPVDGDQLLDGLGLDEGAGVLRALGDDLVDGVEDGDHGVLLQVLGRSLLTAGQVAHQVPHGIASCKGKQAIVLRKIQFNTLDCSMRNFSNFRHNSSVGRGLAEHLSASLQGL